MDTENLTNFGIHKRYEQFYHLTDQLSLRNVVHKDSYKISLYDFFIIKPTRFTNFINLFWHETLHVSSQNKLMKLVHLVGFIIKKFVTMHDHMNLKVYMTLYVYQ